RRRGHRAGLAGGRDAPLRRAPDRRPHCLRPIPARVCDPLSNDKRADHRGPEDIGAMIGLVDRALALNPSFSRGWGLSGLLRLWAGQHDLAIEHVETSLRLSPHERMGIPVAVMGPFLQTS